MKNDLRREILNKRLLIDSHDIQVFSGAIIQALLNLEIVKNARCIMAYCAHKNEPELFALANALLDMGKSIALPYVTKDDNLIAVDYCFDSVMKSNVFGIAEPVITNESEQAEPDVVLVPGIAFDEAGNRIGYGLGYFDRFLKDSRAYKIGVCFDMQIVPLINARPHDVRMDLIVTQSRVIHTKC
ncbi:MAG: 5-formyltetrahydrofolate cyclo-ligase [Christensenellales bacterium]